MITLELLQGKFLKPLPGKPAHAQFYPNRIGNDQNPSQDPKLRMSAVAVILYNNANQEPCTLLIQRPTYEGTHSGQVAFPGGKWEASDASLKATALRECMEEVGIAENELQYTGKLTDVYIPVSSFLVEPYVFFWPEPRTSLTLSEREVTQVYETPISELSDENIGKIDVEIALNTYIRDVPHFILPDYRIWGATAIMLNELRLLLRESETETGEAKSS